MTSNDNPSAALLCEQDQEKILKAHMRMRAIHHPMRLRILMTLLASGEMMVTRIQVALRISEQSALSRELAILRRADLVTTRRDGKAVLYSVKTQALAKLIDSAYDLSEGVGYTTKKI